MAENPRTPSMRAVDAREYVDQESPWLSPRQALKNAAVLVPTWMVVWVLTAVMHVPSWIGLILGLVVIAAVGAVQMILRSRTR